MCRVISMPGAIIAALVFALRRSLIVIASAYAYAIVSIYRDPYFLSGIVSGVSLESTTKTANRLAGSLSLAFSLIL